MLLKIRSHVDGENRTAFVPVSTASAMYDAKLLSLKDGIDMPSDMIEFASQWYDGQTSMLYAAASCRGLVRGTVRPMTTDDEGNRVHMTDLEWYRDLWISLGREVRELQRTMHNADDHARAGKFLQYIEMALEALPNVAE